jgi:hypothetical protein
VHGRAFDLAVLGERSGGAQDLSIGGLLYESATREPDAVALIARVLRQLELL